MQSPAFSAMLKPNQYNRSTLIFIGINLSVFVAMAISGVSVFEPSNEDLLKWGANFRPSTTAGEWWRLLTACFVHIGIFHVALNMYALLYIGVLLEPLIGGIRLAVAYLVTGLLASVMSLWWHELIISAGASGAIFGLYGVFIALLAGGLVEKNVRKDLLTSMLLFVGYNLIFGLKAGIDNAAHIGGLIAGLLFGFALLPGLKNPEEKTIKNASLTIAALVVVLVAVWAMSNIKNDLPAYDAEMEHFQDMESMALDVYKMPADADKELILEEIQDRGIYYWKECIKLIDGFDRMSLPEELEAQNKKLRTYCELRIESYNLLYRKIKEESDLYDAEIEALDKRIEALIVELTGKS